MLYYTKDLTLWASLLEQTVYEGEHVMTGGRDAGHKQFTAIPSATGGIARLPSVVWKDAARDAIQRKVYARTAKAVLGPCFSLMCRLCSTALE